MQRYQNVRFFAQKYDIFTTLNPKRSPLPKFYTFKSRDERERILYKNFVQVGQDVKAMIADINNKKNAK